MPIVATPSTDVRNKNILLIILFAAFAAWFAYDGWIGWPHKNDLLVQSMMTDKHTNPGDVPALQAWDSKGGWNAAASEEREHLHKLIESNNREGWHTEIEMLTQKIIVAVLALATLGAIIYAVRCQRRRATADEQGLSPAPGIQIPWTQINTIDNTRWKKSGIVCVRYIDSAATEQTALLDDYVLDNLPQVLSEISVRASRAKVVEPRAEEPTPI